MRAMHILSVIAFARPCSPDFRHEAADRGDNHLIIPFVLFFSRTAEIEHRAFHMLQKCSAAEPQPFVLIFLFEPHILAGQFLPQPLEGGMRTRRGRGEESRDQGHGEGAAEGVTLNQRVLPNSDSQQCLKLCLPLVTILAISGLPRSSPVSLRS